MTKSIRNIYIPIALFVLNIFLKILHIDSNDIALDEPFSIFHSQKNITEIIHFLLTGNNPPLYEILLHYWVKLFGTDAFEVRFPSLVFSSLTCILIYVIAIKFYDVTAGIVVSLVYTFSTIHIYFAHEARVYALFVMLTACSILFYLSYIRSFQKRDFLLLLTSNLLLVYSYYLGWVVIVIQMFFPVFIKVETKRITKSILLNNLLLLILFSPVLFNFILRVEDYFNGGTWLRKPQLDDIYETVRKFSNAPVVAVIFISLLGVSSIKYFYKKTPVAVATKFMVFFFITSYFGLFLISHIASVFYDRYLIFITIPYYFLIIISTSFLFTNNTVRITAMTLLVFSMIYTSHINPGNKRQIKKTVELAAEWKDDKTVLGIMPWWLDVGVMYYYNREIFKDTETFNQRMKEENIFPSNDLQSLKKISEDNNLNIMLIVEKSRVDSITLFQTLKPDFESYTYKNFDGLLVCKFYNRK